MFQSSLIQANAREPRLLYFLCQKELVRKVPGADLLDELISCNLLVKFRVILIEYKK